MRNSTLCWKILAKLSEADPLHAIFEVGVATVRNAAEHVGYAELAADALAEIEDRRRQARRRRSSWADNR